jgi:hypothetical protein
LNEKDSSSVTDYPSDDIMKILDEPDSESKAPDVENDDKRTFRPIKK